MLKELFQVFSPRKNSKKISNEKISTIKQPILELKYNKKCNIQVSIESAQELQPFTDNFKEHLDIFILCRIKKHEKKTRIVNTKQEPLWEEVFSFEGILLSELENEILIEFELYDYDDVLDQNIMLGYGCKKIGIQELEKLDTYLSELNLENKSNHTCAILKIKVSLFSELIN